MKTNLKSKVKVYIVLMSVLLTGVFMQSCIQDESASIESYLPFLDVKNDFSKLTIEDFQIIIEGYKRIEPYVKIKDDHFYLTISSGKQIAISEQLFINFVEAINVANERINDGELFIIDGKIFDNSFIDIIKNPRLKSNVEGNNSNYTYVMNSYFWGTATTISFTQQGAQEFYNAYSSYSSHLSGVLGIAATVFGFNPAAGTALGIASAVTYLSSSIYGPQIYNAAQQGAITVTIYEMTYPSYSKTTTISDKDGNTVAILTNF
jgi:hypothetical protein